MNDVRPHVREAGHGPGVVCLHANVSHSVQWRALMDQLAPSFHVLAPDSFGAGRSPAWTCERPLSMADELALLAPVFERAGDAFALIGHSYGAALALVAAARWPRRVRCLALYEPTLFSLLDAHQAPPNGADGIRCVVADVAKALSLGDGRAAARRFIDFWMGPGSWQSLPQSRRDGIESTIAHAGDWAHALFNEPTPLAALTALDIPLLLMAGRRSPAASRDVARLLASAWPGVRFIEFDELGHMGPLTHPHLVNEHIAAFLSR